MVQRAALDTAPRLPPGGSPFRVDVNPVVVDLERWQAKDADPFVAQVRGQPLVPIPLVSRT